jgi:endonuclease/exonuclease/phosphatase family metal-dependent hydrolase
MTSSADFTEGYDRTFLDLSSKMAEPFCLAYGLLRYRLVAPLDPGKFDNCNNKILEIATRALIATSAIATFALFPLPIVFTAALLGVTSKVFRAIGFALQKNHYTYAHGSAPEQNLRGGQAKILTWNICGISGGMHYDHGGVLHWRLRLDQIADKIIAENPDVIAFQEIYDTALAEALFAKLKDHYAHFFMHLGANVMGSVGGGMVISRCPVHSFTTSSFTNNDWTLNRTFATLAIKATAAEAHPCADIISTHFIHKDNAKRMGQLAQVVQSAALKAIPAVLMGDLNLDRNKPEEGGVLNNHFHLGADLGPTCTNALVQQWDPKEASVPHENIDYIALFREHTQGAHLTDERLILAFDDTYNTQTALSDHHGRVATLSGLAAAG